MNVDIRIMGMLKWQSDNENILSHIMVGKDQFGEIEFTVVPEKGEQFTLTIDMDEITDALNMLFHLRGKPNGQAA